MHYLISLDFSDRNELNTLKNKLFQCLVIIRKKYDSTNWKYYKICDNQIFCILDCEKLIFSNIPKTSEYIYSIKVLNFDNHHTDITYHQISTINSI